MSEQIKAALRLHGVLWTEDLVSDLAAVMDAYSCEWCQVNERNARRNVADAWDVGYQRGLRDAEQDVTHHADNPYAERDAGR